MYFAEQPFQIDEANLQRSHETPDYIGFREAAVNALVHQDYTDTQRTATVHFYKDASVYFNPGDSLLDESELGKGGSASRNPL
ncbi:AAA family ATPase, partial [Pseudoalteromonas sp. S4492]